jgi:hypothetical protein
VNRARKDLAELRRRLALAGKNGGLSAAECRDLAAPPARGRPRDLPHRRAFIGAHCFRLEHSIALKLAVDETARHFGISRSEVYAVRKWLISSK